MFSKNMLATLCCLFSFITKILSKFMSSVEKSFTNSFGYVTENTTVNTTNFLRGNLELRKK